MHTLRGIVNLALAGLGYLLIYFLFAAVDFDKVLEQHAVYLVGGAVVWSVSRTLYSINSNVTALRELIAASSLVEEAAPRPSANAVTNSLHQLHRAASPVHDDRPAPGSRYRAGA